MHDEPVVLGQQIADARKAEAERISRGDSAPSPLTGQDHYDEWRRDYDLYDPVQLPLDDRLRSLCQEFASCDANARSIMRRSLSLEDFYTLLTFSRRAAVFGLRTRDPRWLVDGLTAIAMIELARIDYRDAHAPIGLIWVVFDLIGVDANPSFADATTLAEPVIADLLTSFHNRPPAQRELKGWCYELVDSPGGPGLLSRSVCAYNPTVPLDKVILQIADLLRDDQYAPGIELATELPDFWLSKIDDGALATALGTVVAGATAHAALRPTAQSDRSNFAIAFLVETATRNASETLLGIARQKQTEAKDFTMVTAQDRQLFCLLIARNFMAGGQAFETDETIVRFLPGLESILRSCPASIVTMRSPTLGSRLRGFVGRLFGP